MQVCTSTGDSSAPFELIRAWDVSRKTKLLPSECGEATISPHGNALRFCGLNNLSKGMAKSLQPHGAEPNNSVVTR